MRIYYRPGMTLAEFAAHWVDMVPHLATLTALASECKSIVEFGVRGGVSTWALLEGLPPDGRMTSYDPDGGVYQMSPPILFDDPRWTFINDFDNRAPIEGPADLVMIDSSHQYEHTAEELLIAAALAPRYIVLHDYLDPPHPGVRRAVDEFVAGDSFRAGPYRIERIEESQWGLAILVPSYS